MERRDYNYYKAHASDVRREDITSSEGNANILKRLRGGTSGSSPVRRATGQLFTWDDKLVNICLDGIERPLFFGGGCNSSLNSSLGNFIIKEGDDLG